MATGKMSFNYYQNGKYGLLPHNPQKDMEVTQDMHLKMSKKIAQLTKVIYALNTKNDENEVVLQIFKDQHEEEKKSLLADMETKIKHYRSKLEEESDHRRQMNILQTRISDFEQQQSSVEEQIAQLKEEAKAREQLLEGSYSRQMQQLTQDVLRAKREFEEHMEGFEAWKMQAEKKHMTELQEVEIKHAQELEQLRSFQRNQDTEWLNQCAVIEEKYSDEIRQLKEKLEASHVERLKMEEDYVEKLAKAQAFYEQELKALQQSETSSFEGELNALRVQQEKLRNDFSAQERELRKQIDSLVRQLADAEDLADALKQENEKLTQEMKSKDSSAESTVQQLQQALQNKEAALVQLQDVERNLAASKERCLDQAADLLKKSALIGELEAHRVQRAAQVEEMMKQIEHLKQELSRAEAEQKTLQLCQKSQTTEQVSQLEFLKQREVTKQRHEREIHSLKKASEEHLHQVQTSLQEKLAAIEKQHLEEKEKDRKAALDDLQQSKQDLEAKFWEEKTKLNDEKNSIQAEFEQVKAELLAKCKQAEEEVARLSSLVQESENGLGAASSHISSLKDAAATLKAELDKTRTELKNTKLHSASLQVELDKLQLLYNTKSAEWQLELKSLLESLAAELDAKWAETMRTECSKLRQEVTAQKDDERRAALEHLARLKDEEMVTDRAGLASHITYLKGQVSELNHKLDLAHSSREDDKNNMQAALEVERARLEAELHKAQQDHKVAVQELEEKHQNSLLQTIQQKDAEREEGEKALKAIHLEDMQAQLSAHKLALVAAKEEAEQLLKARLKDVQEAHCLKQGQLQTELEERHEEILRKVQRDHASVIQAARLELDRAVEISKQKTRDHQLQVQELQENISQHETHIVKLKDEVRKLQAGISSLNVIIVQKDHDAQQAQVDAKEHLRQVEEQLKKEQIRALDNQAADHKHEHEMMIVQFNKAQEILKDKISELQILLLEAEERYRQRDSRPEDLELIHQLRLEVQERELRVAQLIEEKRFYQLELVNRETNFNKVFSSSPNVGLLNPLQLKNKKKGAEGVPAKYLSAPSLGAPTRLDPLPGSPMHDSILNPTKPLPQPAFTKKFVR
ncbi:hypothetical protein C0Q70_02058 [Pomacea canaliculata]|uniref:Protein FAM184A/B N-terminal domain-containing protein n=1 Tax=Pomacea canaliculata TaxID=400727 RepID=A0A2T7Q188_POMCA|nr:hypothetical protein C0Q70_02058 [Pomacea canaliculata]